jgi:hypothetical protein
MRTIVQGLLILIGGVVALFGLLGNEGWAAAIGGIVFLAGGVMWIASPTRPQTLDGGNRPTHDPINQTGRSSDGD